MFTSTRDHLEYMVVPIADVATDFPVSKTVSRHLEACFGDSDGFQLCQSMQVDHPRDRLLVVSRVEDIL